MSLPFATISPEHQAFIERQPMFFVASAPLSGTGHVNLSPKGLDTFRIIDPGTVTYLDLTGSSMERLEEGAKAMPMQVNAAAEPLYIVKPFSGRGVAGLFSTHPPIEERVRRLRALGI